MTRSKEKEEEKLIVEGWKKISKGYKPKGLTEEEQSQFDRAKLVSNQAKTVNFVLSRPIIRNL